MYESPKRYMVVSRSAEDIKRQACSLTCPVMEINSTQPVKEILGLAYSHYMMLQGL